MNASQIDEIFYYLSPQRLQTYKNHCQSQEQALCLYQQNLQLCEKFIKPLQLCEVVLRNAIANALTMVHTEHWFNNQAFIRNLLPIWQNELKNAVAKLGQNANQSLLIPNLSFAFWQSFLTKRLDAVLWNKAFFVVFKNAPSQKSVADNRLFLHQTLDEIRKFRNRIAHHEPIFNKDYDKIYQHIITMIGFCSHSLQAYLQQEYQQSNLKQLMTKTQPQHSPIRHTLHSHAKQIGTIGELFATDDKRADKFHLTAPYMVIDFAKQNITQAVLDDLFNLANECNLPKKINDLLSGQKVNASENRSALHTALRLPKDEWLLVDGVDVVAEVHASLDKCASIAHRIRTGVWRGYSGKAITDVVSIGVGGSDLGPQMAVDALAQYKDTHIAVHFASNMDGTHLHNLLGKLSPETTLFIIASKSFGTIDTLSNASTALAWLTRHTPKEVALRRHFVGVSASPTRMSAWGIHTDNQLVFWDWVGGRFSMWSAISLAVAIAVGKDNFARLLDGAYQMDCHFKTAPLFANAPVIMGLLAVWNATFLAINGHTVLPYDGRLKFLPSYLTQLEMESNGKSVTMDGGAVDYATCPILWGEVGSNAQHAFYQLLHQGTQRVSCDFIACTHRNDSDDAFAHQHRLALANCLAQSRVLAFGNDALPNASTSPNHRYRGNQPSTTILLDSLTPESLGALIALYEHKVYVASVLWRINPFDQWGVEMGKVMANSVFDVLNGQAGEFDGSTNFLLSIIKGAK